jgi:heme/copper-type cytochrome/quinol oxidase subunit 4
MNAADTPAGPGMRFYATVALTLALIVVAEVVVTLEHPSVPRLFATLLVLAVVEAGVALLYFMHLRYEPRRLFWTLVPALVFVFVLMNHIFPDAFSLMHQRLPSP